MSNKTTSAHMTRSESPGLSSGPELFIGLVGAVGSDMDRVSETLSRALREVGYTYDPVLRLSELLHDIPELSLPETKGAFERNTLLDERYDRYMTAANKLRRDTARGDAMAMLGIGAIRRERQAVCGDRNIPQPRHAYIIRSLKNVQEVRALRQIYGSSFVLLGAYSRRDQRVQSLARLIADSHHTLASTDYRHLAEGLVKRDEKETDPFGQNIRDTFPQADVFVDADDQSGLEASISRFMRLLLGDYRHSPTPLEQGMFLAKGASLRSRSLSRQVGAAITGERGEVLALGTNEVPRAGGGMYWEGDSPDGRDIVRGYDTSDQFKRTLLRELLRRLQESKWLAKPFADDDVVTLTEKALGKEGLEYQSPPLKGTRLMDIIEFGRSVHAEMAALIDASTRGVPVAKSWLYTTTFPCHDCARHIVVAGIQRVIYVEPYAKSLAAELYPDSIAVEVPEAEGQIPFLPFIGIAPRRYVEWFEIRGEQKVSSGKLVEWNPLTATPSDVEDPQTYIDREQLEFERFEQAMRAVGFSSRGKVSP